MWGDNTVLSSLSIAFSEVTEAAFIDCNYQMIGFWSLPWVHLRTTITTVAAVKCYLQGCTNNSKNMKQQISDK